MTVSIVAVTHVNVNCSSLERSLPFYRDFVGLHSGSHTNPVPQEGPGFGLPGQVQWDAHIMQDHRAPASPGIDLLEWKQPLPTGKPHAAANELGFFRICLLVPDVGAVYERALAAGVACLSLPAAIPDGAGATALMLCCLDPDGTCIEFVESPTATAPQLFHVNVNCSDLARSVDWYGRVLGLEAKGYSAPGAVSGEGFGLPGEVEWDAKFLRPPGVDTFAIDLLEWKRPTPVGRALSEANHLGIYRMAFLVEDIQAAHEHVRSQGVECAPPVFLDMGPEIPVDGVWASFFPDPDGTCMEFIESPRL